MTWEECEAQADQDRDHRCGAFHELKFGLICSVPLWLGVLHAWWMGWLK